MINLKNTSINKCIIHEIGNKVKFEDLKCSKNELTLDEESNQLLANYFLKHFKTITSTYHFHHAVDLSMNEVFNFSDNIFEGEDFVENSVNIATHLYDETRHPSIKSGELFIAFFDEITLENKICKGLGFFKSERKESFLKVTEKAKNFSLFVDKGISENKLDKGCLIVNDDYQNGFKVFTYEYNNGDTDYWQRDFLSIKPLQDNLSNTTAFINICKEYSEIHIKENYGKTEQFSFLKESLKYIGKAETLDIQKFETDLFEDTGERKTFRDFKKKYLNENEIQILEPFSISKSIVAYEKKKIKNDIKLDTHITIKLDVENSNFSDQFIENGFDSKRRMNYYKIFYNNER